MPAYALSWINLYFFKCYGDHRDLHSFPTRRSSDLCTSTVPTRQHNAVEVRRGVYRPFALECHRERAKYTSSRSEEHTSELQSLTNLVCRLLLEKKKHDKPEQTKTPQCLIAVATAS